MKKKFYGSILERELFHGTGPNDVDKICKQNFDWRLHGKNATMFGAGSYFALKASYSDRSGTAQGEGLEGELQLLPPPPPTTATLPSPPPSTHTHTRCFLPEASHKT